MSVHPVARAFERAAEAYEQARPTYPAEAVEFLASRLDLRPGRRVLDLAAGTGKLTRLLAATGVDVVAVEPIDAMRERLRAAVPRAEVLTGTAEAIPLPAASVDAATVAQAFHWFDHDAAFRELHRVLRRGGALAIVWNTRDPSDPLQAAIDEILRPHQERADARRWEGWEDAPTRAELFGEIEVWTHRWSQQLEREQLAQRIRSTSYVAALPDDEQAELVERVLEAARHLDEPFEFPYVTEVFLCLRQTDHT